VAQGVGPEFKPQYCKKKKKEKEKTKKHYSDHLVHIYFRWLLWHIELGIGYLVNEPCPFNSNSLGDGKVLLSLGNRSSTKEMRLWNLNHEVFMKRLGKEKLQKWQHIWFRYIPTLLSPELMAKFWPSKVDTTDVTLVHGKTSLVWVDVKSFKQIWKCSFSSLQEF
jgi:hypothetical protein